MDLDMDGRVSVLVLRFLLCYGATIQVGFIHRNVRGRLAKHLYSFASWAILSYLLFGSSSILHFLVTMLVGYASMLLLQLIEKVKFLQSDHEGYQNKVGSALMPDFSFYIGAALIHDLRTLCSAVRTAPTGFEERKDKARNGPQKELSCILDPCSFNM